MFRDMLKRIKFIVLVVLGKVNQRKQSIFLCAAKAHMNLLILVLLVMTWVFTIITTRPMIHPETESFLVFYGTPSPEGFLGEIKKFFMPEHTDWNNYQARELGYVFEYIDAKMILMANPNPIFLYGFRSITQIIFIILTACVLYLIVRECFKTFSKKTCIVIAMLFPLSVQMQMMETIFFRSGKTVIAFWTSLWILCFIRCLKYSNINQNTGKYILLSVGAFFSFITDKQGVLIGLWLIGLSFFVSFMRMIHKKTYRETLLFASSFIVAFGVYLYWDYSLCPHIIKSVTGSYPVRNWSSLRYFTQIDLKSYIYGLWIGLKLVALQIQLAFGNVKDGNWFSWGLAFVSYFLLLFPIIRKMTGRTIDSTEKSSIQGCMDKSTLVTILVSALIFCVAKVALLFLRHRPLAWPDIWRSGYYYQGVTIILIIGFVIALAVLNDKTKQFERRIVYIVLLICLANFVSSNKTKNISWNGHLKESYEKNLRYDKEIKMGLVTQETSPIVKFILHQNNRLFNFRNPEARKWMMEVK